MRTIKAFKTDDGQIFETKHDALRHEKRVEFITWYQKDPLTVDASSYNDYIVVTEDEMTEWLKKRNAYIAQYVEETTNE